MVKSVIFILIVILVSCATISNDSKKRLLKQDEIGVFNSTFRTDGYYYKEKHERIFINYSLYNKKGFMFFKSTFAGISFDSLHLLLKKDLVKPKTFIKKEDIFFLNKNAQVWNTGVYRAEGNKIHIQSFGNYAGNYYLVNYYGKIENDTILKLVYEEKPKDTLIYKFMPCEVGEFKTYIEENPKKFWKD